MFCFGETWLSGFSFGVFTLDQVSDWLAGEVDIFFQKLPSDMVTYVNEQFRLLIGGSM